MHQASRGRTLAWGTDGLDTLSRSTISKRRVISWGTTRPLQKKTGRASRVQPMGIFGDETPNSVKRKSSTRSNLMQMIGLLSIVAHSLITWQGLILVFGTKSPIVVVLSSSMEPAFKRGDVVFLRNSNNPIQVGEIVVYQLPGREIPIIHRVVRLHEKSDGSGAAGVEFLTKGDHNHVDDLGLYEEAVPGLRWLEREHIMGRAVGLLPSVGWTTLVLQEYPIVKYTLFPALAVALLSLDRLLS